MVICQWNGHRIHQWSRPLEPRGANKLFNHTDDYAIGRRNNEVAMIHRQQCRSPELFDSSGFFYDGWLDEFAFTMWLSPNRIKAHYDAGMTEVPFTPDTGGVGGDGQINSIALSDGSVVIEFEGVFEECLQCYGPIRAGSWCHLLTRWLRTSQPSSTSLNKLSAFQSID